MSTGLRVDDPPSSGVKHGYVYRLGCVFEQDPQFLLIPEQEKAIFSKPVWKTGSLVQFSEMGSDLKLPLHSLNQERRNL